MSLTLHLGNIDLPYSGQDVTTGDVAGWLEDNYGVMGAFVAIHLPEIEHAITESILGALDTLVNGGPVSTNPFAQGTDAIEQEFRNFLTLEEMNGFPGVPTQAAIDRRSSRFKSKRGASQRPSFVDTGLYRQTFKTWMT